MDKEKKNRSGSMSDRGSSESRGEHGRSHLEGSPEKSNRQTGDSKRREKDDSSGGAENYTTKKGPNNI